MRGVLAHLAATLATTLGHSVAHRPITVVRMGDPTAKRKVLVVGCIHGNETAGLAVTRALKKTSPPAGTQYLIVDVLNPDGRAAHTRANAHGVDLNRNFPTGWKRMAGTYASGPRPSSEPETRLIERLILREKPAVSVWFHQHMNLIDNTRGSDPKLIRAYAKAAHMRAVRLAQLPGTATRWTMHRLPGKTSFVVELPAGALSKAAVDRQVRAIGAVAR